MSNKKIQDLPLKTPLDAMKIPTGGFGDYAVTLKTIIDHFIEKYNLVQEDQISELERNVKLELDKKVNKNNVYTKEEIDRLIALVNGGLSEEIVKNLTLLENLDNELQGKANSSDVYLKTETYSQQEVNVGLDSKIETVNGKTGKEITLTRDDIGVPTNAEISALKKEDAYVITESGITQREMNRVLLTQAQQAKDYVDNAVFKSANGVKNFSNEAELKTYTPKNDDPLFAYAFDTGHSFEWVNNTWVDLGRSQIDSLKDYVDLSDDLPVVSSAFFTAGSDYAGLATINNKVYKSATYPYIPNSRVRLKRNGESNYYTGVSFSNNPDNFIQPIWKAEQEIIVTNPTAKYVRFYTKRVNEADITDSEIKNTKMSFEVLKFIADDNVVIPNYKHYLDKTVITTADFEMNTDISDTTISTSNVIAKSKTFHFPEGAEITINRQASRDGIDLYWAFAISDDDFLFTKGGWKRELTDTITVTKDKPYLRIYLRDINNTAFTDAKLKACGFYAITDKSNLYNEITLAKYTNKSKYFTLTKQDFDYGAYDGRGITKTGAVFAQTKVFRIPKNAKAKIQIPQTNPLFVWSYSLSDQVTAHNAVSLVNERTASIDFANSSEKYLRFYVRRQDNLAMTESDLSVLDITIQFNFTENEVAIIESIDKQNQGVIKLKASDFIIGEAESRENITRASRARSKLVYKLPVGTKVSIGYDKTNRDFYYSYGVSATVASIKRSRAFLAEEVTTFTIEEGMQYLRFYVTLKVGGNFTQADLTDDRFGISIEIPNPVAKLSDIAEAQTAQLGYTSVMNRVFDYNSSFRLPSLAKGGVVTFIDDDGRDGCFNDLYPVTQEHGIPYGLAVSPGLLGTTGYMTEAQVLEVAQSPNIEIQSHTYTHARLEDITDREVMKLQIERARSWFISKGIIVDSFVYPYGSDNTLTHQVVGQYYSSAYDFNSYNLVNFNNIRNFRINRAKLSKDGDFEILKPMIDQAVAENAWLIITTHAGNPEGNGIWWEGQNTLDDVVALYNYAKEKGCQVLKPREAFQIFGNIIENDSGFRITSEGAMIGLKN